MIPVILAAAVGLASATGTYFWQENRYERQLSNLRADQATALAQANANALAETQRLQKAKDAALKQASVRQAALARDLAANRAGLTGLSHAADSALRGASDSLSACNANANTLTVVFGRCAGQLSDMAADADRLLSDKQTLIEAWPQ